MPKKKKPNPEQDLPPYLPQLVKPSVLNRGKGPTILVFGEAPGKEEMIKGLAFVGPAGDLLRIFLSGIKRYQIILDNVCPEVLDRGHGKPDTAILRKYAKYRDKRIASTKPVAIIAVGKFAMVALGLMKASESVMARHGRAYAGPHGIPVICSLHPSWFLRQGQDSPTWEKMSRVFVALRSELHGDGGKKDYHISSTCVWAKKGKDLWAMDLETSSLDPKKGRILCAAISNGKHKYFIPLYHSTTWDEHTGAVAKTFCKWWSQGPRIVHNAKFECRWMHALGAEQPPQVIDSMLESWLVDENHNRDLNDLVTQVLGQPAYWHEIDHKKMAQLPIRTIATYNVKDAHASFQLHKKFKTQLSSKQQKLLEGVLQPLQGLLLEMERTGIHVDQKRLKGLLRIQKGKITKLLKGVQTTFPGLNVRSHVQMSLLAKQQGWEVVKRTKRTADGKGGKPSWDEEALGVLVTKGVPVKDLLALRKAQSFLSLLQSWVKHSQEDGFIHTSFNMALTTTGRLSSSGPNMQNITRDGAQRECLTSRFNGGKIIQIDYAQHEFRIMCAVAGQTDVLKAFEEGLDVHQRTADEMTNIHGIPLSRQEAKSCNFGLIYGMTEWGLEKNYGVPLDKARRVRKVWFKSYDKIAAYHRQIETSVREKGYVASVFDWRRHLDDPGDRHQMRQAYNHPIQNAAAVICYMAMLDIRNWLKQEDWVSMVIHQIHDSIILDCPVTEFRRVGEGAKILMESVTYEKITGKLKHPIPLLAEVKVGAHL